MCEEVKKKLQNLESLRDSDSDPLDFLLQRETKTLSQDYKKVVSSISSSSSATSSISSSNQNHIFIMENIFAPLVLPVNLHNLPQGYAKRLKVWSRRRHHITITS